MVAAIAIGPQSARAADLDEAAATFDIVAGLTEAPAALPPGVEAPGDGPSGAAPGPGYSYVVTNEAIADLDGDLVSGAVPLQQVGGMLGADGTTNLGVWTPLDGHSGFVLGESLVQGVEIRMDGRVPGGDVTRHASGAYIEAAHGGGADELVTLAPGELEQLLLLEPGDTGSTFTYRVVGGAAAGARLVALDDARLVLVDAQGNGLVEILAPWAVDEAGTQVPVSLHVTGSDRFELRVDRGGVTGSVLVDPIFRLSTIRVTADGDTPLYQAWWCGPLASDLDDRYTASPGGNEDPDVRTLCNNKLTGMTQWSSSAGAKDEPGKVFDVDGDSGGQQNGTTGTGLQIGLRTGGGAVAAGSEGWVQLASPAYPAAPGYPTTPAGGIVASKFRGTIHDTSGAVSCRIQYVGGNPVQPAAFVDPAGQQRLWAGHPWGGDAVAHWAQFPVPATAPGQPGQTLAPIANGRDPRARMVGYFDAITSSGEPYVAPAPVNQVDAIRLTMRVPSALSAAQVNPNRHRCGADGLWWVLVNDNDPVRISDAPELASEWYSEEYLQQIDTNRGSDMSEAFRTIKVEDWGSGIRSARLSIGLIPPSVAVTPGDETEADRWRKYGCEDYVRFDNDGTGGGEIVGGAITSQGGVTSNGKGMTPCPNEIDGKVSGNVRPTDVPDSKDLITLADRTAGPHYFQLVAHDFAQRSARSEVTPATRPTRHTDDGSERGWYWVDTQPPSCQNQTSGATGIQVVDPEQDGIADIVVNIHDAGWRVDGDARTQLGSGVGRVSVKITSREGGPLTLERNATHLERNAGTITFTDVDVWGVSSPTAGRWVSAEINAKIAVELQDLATLKGGAAERAKHVGACEQLAAYPRVDTTPPSCTSGQPDPSVAPGSIHVLESTIVGRSGTVRVYADDPVSRPIDRQRAEVGEIQLVVNGASTRSRTLDDADRARGYVDFPDVDLLDGLGLPASAVWTSHLSRQRAVSLQAVVLDRTTLLAPGHASQHRASCAVTVPLRLDDVQPTCIDTPTGNAWEAPTSIHVLEHTIVGQRGTVRVYVVDPDSPVQGRADLGTVQLTVGGIVVRTQTLDDTERAQGYVDFANVDLFQGLTLPAGADWWSFLSAQKYVKISALATDRTIILAPADTAKHQVTCSRDVPLRLDDVKPTCVNQTLGDFNRPIHLIDPDKDGYGTVRVHFADPGEHDVPPTGAGVGKVRIALNGGAWIEHAPVTDAERARGYVEFDPIDFYQGITANAYVVGGVTYFTRSTLVKVKAQVEDRTLLVNANHRNQHLGDCDIEQRFDPPSAVAGLDVVRGADNVVGVWPQVPGARGYMWHCERNNPRTLLEADSWFLGSDPARRVDLTTGPAEFNGGVAIPPDVYHNTGACDYPPGGTNRDVRVTVRSEVSRILSPEVFGLETVDRRPLGVAGEPTEDVTVDQHKWLGYLWMSENGVTRDFNSRDDAIAVFVRDPDGEEDLLDGSDPDERILGAAVIGGDHARVLIGVTDRTPLSSPGNRHQDGGGAFVTLQTARDSSEVLMRLTSGAMDPDQTKAPLTANGVDTCGYGDPAIVTAYWVLRCDLLTPTTFATHTGGNSTTARNGYVRFDVPLQPRDYRDFPLRPGETAPADSVAHPDEPGFDRWWFDVHAGVRDRRQRADHAFLWQDSVPYPTNPPNIAIPPVPAPPAPVETDIPHTGTINKLVVDRVVPTIDVLQVSRNSQNGRVDFHLETTDPRPSGATDPAERDASGLRDVNLRIYSTNGIATTVLRTLQPSDCTPRVPLDESTPFDQRHGSAVCDLVIPGLSSSTSYRIEVTVRDMATNVITRDAPVDEQDVTPPKCGPIVVTDPDMDGIATVRIPFTDPGAVPSGVETIRLQVGTSAWIDHAVTAAERAQGYFDFVDVDVLALSGAIPVTGSNGQTYYVGNFQTVLRGQAIDFVGNVGACQFTYSDNNAPAAPVVETVRGADELVGVWPSMPGVDGYLASCLVAVGPAGFTDRYVDPSDPARVKDLTSSPGLTNNGVAIPQLEWVNSGACSVNPSDVVNRRTARHRVRSLRGRRASLTGQSGLVTSDAAPTVYSPRPDETFANGVTYRDHRWSSHNGDPRFGGTRTDALDLLIGDLDGVADVSQGSDPDERILGAAAAALAGDRARFVIGVQDDPSLTYEGSAHVVVQTGAPAKAATPSSPAEPRVPALYRFAQGIAPVDAATAPLDATDPDTCEAGDPAIVRGLWVLRCDLLPLDPPTVAWPVTGFISQGVRYDVLVEPRDLSRYPLRPGEAADPLSQANPRYATTDRYSFGVQAQPRDRRQPADHQFLNSAAQAADAPIPGQGKFGSPHGRFVTDRVVPVVDQMTALPGATWQQVTVQVKAHDPVPTASSDPRTLDPSGMRSVEIRIVDASGTDVGGRMLTPAECSPSMPLGQNVTTNRQRSYTCNADIALPTGLVSTFDVVAKVRDMATNVGSATKSLTPPGPPVVPPTVTAVRGAGGVAAWWPVVAGATTYRYTCVVGGVVGTEEDAVASAVAGTWRTNLCVAPPGATVEVRVVSVDGSGGRSAPATATERVDRAPTIVGTTSGTPYFTVNTDTPPGEFGRDPVVSIRATDLDGDLVSASAPDAHFAGMPTRNPAGPGDAARVILDVHGAPANAAIDAAPSVRLVLFSSGSPSGAWQVAIDEPPFVADPETAPASAFPSRCTEGASSFLVDVGGTTNWQVACARFDVVTTGTVADVVTGLRPRRVNSLDAQRFAGLAKEQQYVVHGYVRDRRQAADNRYLSSQGAKPDSASGRTGTGGDLFRFGIDGYEPSRNNPVLVTRDVTPSGDVEFELREEFVDLPAVVGGEVTEFDSAYVDVYELDPSGARSQPPIERFALSCGTHNPSPARTTCTGRSSALDATREYELRLSALDTAGNVRRWFVYRTSPRYVARLAQSFGDSGNVTTEVGTFDSRVEDLVELESGAIVSVGGMREEGAEYDEGATIGLTKHFADGTPDFSFGVDGIAAVDAGMVTTAVEVEELDGGKLIVTGGGAEDVDAHMVALRLNADGSLDPTFGDGGVARSPASLHAFGSRAIVQPDGKIVQIGWINQAPAGPHGSEKLIATRWTQDGQVDTTFGDGGYRVISTGDRAFAEKVTAAPNGDVVVVGYSYDPTVPTANRRTDMVVARLDADGDPVTSFGGGDGVVLLPGTTSAAGEASARAVEVDDQGRVVVAGPFTQSGPGPSRMYRLLLDGSVDETFAGDGVATIQFPVSASATTAALDMVIDDTGRIVVTGGAGRMMMARFLPNGAPDDSFVEGGIGLNQGLPHSYGLGLAIEIADDGDYIVGGETLNWQDRGVYVLSKFEAAPAEPEAP